MSGPALVMRDVRVRWEPGGAPVLDGVSLSVAAGERVALMGLNGSGKTTLLLAAAGVVPHEGLVEVCGVAVSRGTAAAARERIGFLFNVPEDQLLFPHVLEDVAFGLLRRGARRGEALERARAALESVGAAHLAGVPLHHLSHGQKQRVALAGALCASPPLLLLDEPSAGLDPPGKRAVAARLAGLGAAMLVATHDAAFAERLCTRFVLLEGGRIAAGGDGAAAVLDRWDGA